MKLNAIILTIVSIILMASNCNPEASFTHDCIGCEAGDPVQFTSTSLNAETLNWDFGDGNVSTAENPINIFNEKGKYTVRLTVSNNHGSDSESKELSISGPKGYIVDTLVYSHGLEGNLLGDSPTREVSIYLPPGYVDEPDTRYPVIYFIHGFLQTNKVWTGGHGVVNTDLGKIMNALLDQDQIDPMIIVVPNSNNLYDGSWYTNSSSTGDWEDFIVKDVVQFIDDNYRTIPERESRGIAGHSMGGYGTIKLAMRNPGLFSSAYMLSAAWLVFEDVILGTMKTWVQAAACADVYDGLNWQAQAMIAGAAAFAPDPTATFYGQLPVTCTGVLIDSVWNKWLQHDPYTMILTYTDNLNQYEAIHFDCGTSDDDLFDATVHFAEALSSFENVHFEEYAGDHVNKLPERVENKLLPFFSENLNHDEK